VERVFHLAATHVLLHGTSMAIMLIIVYLFIPTGCSKRPWSRWRQALLSWR